MCLKMILPCLNHKFSRVERYVNRFDKLKILDVGAGNHSASITKERYPNCIYHGVDINKNYNNDETDFLCMDQFYEMDLTKLEFNDVPENYFDIIFLSHIIEHLYNGDLVIKKLLSKLSEGGIVYIEWPGIKSTQLPSMKGTLNFFDDSSHIRIYTLSEIYNLLLSNSMTYLGGGRRRFKRLILILPLKIVHNKLKYGYIQGGIFWDVLGFAEYAIFIKHNKTVEL